MLINVSLANHATRPTASRPPNRWGDRVAARMPNQTKAPSRSQDQGGADEAQLLADDREDEVGLGIGEEPPLRLPTAETGPDEVARAQADQRLHHLVARPELRGRTGRGRTTSRSRR